MTKIAKEITTMKTYKIMFSGEVDIEAKTQEDAEMDSDGGYIC